MDNNYDLETLWQHLLSREPYKVQSAFSGLDKESQREVLEHLTRMSVEADWHPEQRISAQAALKALDLTS
jgi:hypothetical protein